MISATGPLPATSQSLEGFPGKYSTGSAPECSPQVIQFAGPILIHGSRSGLSVVWSPSVKPNCREEYVGTARAVRRCAVLLGQHYDIAINYVAHAEKWDSPAIDGDISQRICSVRFNRGGRTLALVTIGRDLESLKGEAAMEGAGQE